MGLGGFLRSLFGIADKGHGVDELARRLKCMPEILREAGPSYHEFKIPKRSGGVRTICAPDDELKKLQRRILRYVLRRLRCHEAVHGFERGRSIVTNASAHCGKAVVVRMDIRNFFPSTSAKRVRDYFRAIGWNREASDLLVKLLTHRGGLPQGAPTSPRLSNLVNRRLDMRLDALAKSLGAVYTRYADDLTLSFEADDPGVVRKAVFLAGQIVREEGYRVHKRRKLSVRRRNARQVVTGLVVNDYANLPRKTRRWLRAVEHHLATNRPSTLTPERLAGWKSFRSMVEAGPQVAES